MKERKLYQFSLSTLVSGLMVMLAGGAALGQWVTVQSWRLVLWDLVPVVVLYGVFLWHCAKDARAIKQQRLAEAGIHA